VCICFKVYWDVQMGLIPNWWVVLSFTMCSSKCLQDKRDKTIWKLIECPWMGGWVLIFNILVDTYLKHATSSTQKVAEESFVSWNTWSADHFSAYISHLVEQKFDGFIQVSVALTDTHFISSRLLPPILVLLK
jgi:hypothetical protein